MKGLEPPQGDNSRQFDTLNSLTPSTPTPSTNHQIERIDLDLAASSSPNLSLLVNLIQIPDLIHSTHSTH